MKQSYQKQYGSNENSVSFAYGIITASILVTILLVINNSIGITGYSRPIYGTYLFITLFSMANFTAAWLLLHKRELNKKKVIQIATLTFIPTVISATLTFSIQTFNLGILYSLGIISLEMTVLYWLLKQSKKQKTNSSVLVEHKGNTITENELNPNLKIEINPLTLNEEQCEFKDGEQDEDVQHQMSRCKLQNGTETITGMVKMVIPPKTQTESIHLSFCPAFKNRPHIECEILADIPVRVRVAEMRNYGARLEIRRSENLEQECLVEVEYFIQEVAEEKGTVQDKNVA